MLYKEGYDETGLKIFKIPKNAVRAYRLENNDIFIVNQLVLQFENRILYEVIKNGTDMFGQLKWKRTGKTFTLEQLNHYIAK